MRQTKSVCIAGGGVIGLCTAWYALQKGFAVTILERGDPEHDGCSRGNAGMIVPSHFVPLAAPGMVWYGLKMLANPESPFAIRPRLDPKLLDWGWKFLQAANADHVARSSPLLLELNLQSRACYEDFAARFHDAFGLTKKGLLMLCKTEETLEAEAHLAETAQQLGLPAQVLDAKATAACDPNITMDIAGAVYFPQDCHLSPNRFLAGLTRELTDDGAEFVWNANVTGWRADGRSIAAVRTTQGDFAADEYVIAGGAWSPEMARELNLSLPMQAGKGYSLTLSDPYQQPEICAILTEARIAVTPMGNSLRFAGTMEITGLDERINARRVQGIIKSIPQYYPEFRQADFVGQPVWSGLRPCSPDGLPYIGRTARYSNLSIAAGHAMMGLSLGPITGKLLAEVLAGETPSLPLALLSPDRYARHRKNLL